MIFKTVLGAIAALLCAVPAIAKDVVRVVDSQALVFDAYAIYLANEDGYFDAGPVMDAEAKKMVDILYEEAKT